RTVHGSCIESPNLAPTAPEFLRWHQIRTRPARSRPQRWSVSVGERCHGPPAGLGTGGARGVEFGAPLEDTHRPGFAGMSTGPPLLIDAARHLDPFLARLFHIEPEVHALNRRTADDRTVCEFKKRFLDRLVLKTPPEPQELAAVHVADVEFRYRERVAEVLPRGEWANDPEREMAEVVLRVLDRQATAKLPGESSEAAR